MRKIVSLALLAAVALGQTPASAKVQIGQDGSYRIQVPYSDLNLASEGGMRTLQGRMNMAASAVCGTTQASSLGVIRAANACRDTINEAARPQIDQAQRGFGRGIVISEGR